MWTDLVRAYESKLSVLEEARAAYAKAVSDAINQAHLAMEVQIGRVLQGTDWQMRAAVIASGEKAVLPAAPWSCITVFDEFAGTEFRIAAYVASSWGGPAGVLRVALSLEQVHSALDLKTWIRRCGELVDASVVGDPFDPLDWSKFPETSPDWDTIRIASIELVDVDSRDAAREAGMAARVFAELALPMLQLIRTEVAPILRAEKALLEYRQDLEARAQTVGVAVSPLRGSLGPWRGGKYLQVNDFWLATDPASRRLVASSNKRDREVLELLARRLGQQSHLEDVVVVLSEEQLRDPSFSVEAVISSAFDLWFATKGDGFSIPEPADDPDALDPSCQSVDENP